MEFLRRANSVKLNKNVLKVDKSQKYKEYLLTQLDENIYENVNEITEDEIKKYINSKDNFSLIYDRCRLEYNKDKNYFLVKYYINGSFYKEEFYQYIVRDNSILYGCVDYSYKEGMLK